MYSSITQSPKRMWGLLSVAQHPPESTSYDVHQWENNGDVMHTRAIWDWGTGEGTGEEGHHRTRHRRDRSSQDGAQAREAITRRGTGDAGHHRTGHRRGTPSRDEAQARKTAKMVTHTNTCTHTRSHCKWAISRMCPKNTSRRWYMHRHATAVRQQFRWREMTTVYSRIHFRFGTITKNFMFN